MKTFLKIFIGLLVLVIIAVVAFAYTFDANNYKQELTNVAETVITRPINIAGDIDISIYPWIGIKVNDVTIENPPGFSKKTFATIGQFDIRIKILPLLQKHLDIEKLVLHRLAVNFEKNASGENNWSNFSNDTEGDNTKSEFSGLVIGGIELANSSLTWLDINTGKQFKISTLNLGTEAVVKGQPLPLNLNAFIESNQPEWQASVNVKTKLEFNDSSAVFNANDLKLVVKALFPGSKVDKVSFAMVANSTIDPNAQKAKLSNAKFSVLGLVMSGTFDVDNIFSIPVIQGPLKVKTFEAHKLAKYLKIDLPLMANAKSLKSISLETSFRTDFNSIYLDDISAKIDDSGVNGFFRIAGFNNPMVRFALKVDQVKLDDYKAIGGKESENKMPLPLDLIRSTDLEGVFDVENIIFDDVELSKFHVTSKAKNGLFKASPITALVGSSGVKATLQLDVRKNPVGVFAAKVSNVEAKSSINPLLKSIIGNDQLSLEGIVNADVSLKTKGSSVSAMKKALRGTVKLNMGKTIVKGIDPEHSSRSVAAEYANKHKFRTSQSFVSEYRPDRKIEFKSLRASFKVIGSEFRNSDLLLVSDKVNITGSGGIDFSRGEIDYRPVFDIHVSNRIDVRDKLRDHPMEYHAHGPFENIVYKFDIEKYELLVGRLLVQEGKERRIRQKKNKSKNAWENVLSK